MTTIRVLVADDHPLVRTGLRKILEEVGEWEVVAEAGNGRDAVRQALALRPDVAILDIAMPELNGIEATAQICRREPGVRVLILSMYADEAYVVQAMHAGARGYLLKESADAEVVRAVTAVAQGKSFFSPEIARIMLDEYTRQVADRALAGPGRLLADPYSALSEREREIFQLIAEGRANRQIAELLHLSPNTVETHRAHVMEKLHLHSAAELVLYAVRKGIIR
jgi:DNA-binding NarL/FixJ family response regulator